MIFTNWYVKQVQNNTPEEKVCREEWPKHLPQTSPVPVYDDPRVVVPDKLDF